MEEGEIHDSSNFTRSSGRTSPRNMYDPSYEWPWDSTSLERPVPQEPILNREAERSSLLTNSNSATSTHSCRLVVSHTRILPKLHRVALLDGYTEVQLGRDAALDTVPKIRLREMEVSKLHATIYWDQAWNRWGLVDMGSKHGTFQRSVLGEATDSDARGTRISSPKTASLPKKLHHLDAITIGSTTFIVHIHEDGIPCLECSPKHADNEIPLFPSSKKRPIASREGSSDTVRELTTASSSKAALSQLKRELLIRHDEPSGRKTTPSRYVDRSARRRAMYPSSTADTPGIAASSSFREANLAEPSPEPPAATVSQPAVPLSSSNVGHMLLMKQGWTPGTSLGTGDDGRIDPLDVKVRNDRAGLGSSSSAEVVGGQSNDGPVNKYSRWPGLG
ncbi:hypothetical protein V5O48_015521 [Marasmius crinis-equi]|uniref:Angiogenic factor with G patch and FHA domains 1 n=1 Tax=Marasmius crinis-equi TaxID=585013 RepID=A0ABR3EUB5_9AGAR